MKKLSLAIAVMAAAFLVLTGCSSAGSGASSTDDGTIRIVASTTVYGDIARTIAGDAADVTSIIVDPAQDPHSFEASAQDQLAISKADIVIENGGGYDDFVGTMLKATSNDKRIVLNVVDLSGKQINAETHAHHDHVHGEFNEHVWYDFPAMQNLTDELVTVLSEADPSKQSTFEANGKALGEKLTALDDRAAQIASKHAGEKVVVTEPAPLYLLEAAGLENVTPEAFSEAVEEGVDVSPVAVKDMLDLIQGGTVKLLAYNEQTTGPETKKVLAAAEQAGVPLVPVTENLPSGKDYIDWMNANLDAVSAALGG